ncbi:amino acid ABC transporter substrate-binding protein [Fructobacillus parabroussonetiae]|uniref:Amino acid ABC transporter substrate-binding protein n=1 Tax=Fructobacillus parabroussonetiae TaxID=2713174 RepID=A0ABS5QWU5_9LACO|nr:amino acid ABC transporter substrate-binding protein [Fructobacillus parabroussonetiae]MBS9337675.1 amino acid ABC transporter substrate-binding protein [Fructobacillus parabroussonetiae]MCK8617313.1 amino acid ABC transporter substrate-binding protein [Fructobacillus parabroussonetiae]
MISKQKKILVNSLVAMVFFGLLALAVFAILKPSNGNVQPRNDTWSEIKSRKTITIGLDDTFVPMGFRNSSGKIVGFDVDLAEKVFSNLGIKVNWQPIDWSMKETELNTGNIDALWNGYTKTPERAKQVAFSTTYHRAQLALVVKKSSGVRSFEGMSGKVLGVQTGSSGETALNNQPNVLKRYIAGQKAVGYDTFDKAFTDLNANRINGLLVDEDYARYYIKQQANPNDYDILTGPFAISDDVVAFRKGDKGLQKAVDEQLAKLTKSGYLANLEERWFGKSSQNLR